MYVCMYACIHTYLHTYVHTYIHTYMHTYIYIYMYTYIYICTQNPITLNDAFPSRALARGCGACRYVQGLDTGALDLGLVRVLMISLLSFWGSLAVVEGWYKALWG